MQAQLAQHAESSGQHSAALAQLIAGVDRAGHLVEQLLQMARLEPDAAQFPFAVLRLDRLAKDVVGEFAALADAKGVDLGMAGSRAVEVRGNAESLRVLLSNLVDNAVRYTPAGGRVDVAVDVGVGAMAAQAVVSVSDTGPGIPAEARTRVFDRFYRGAKQSVPGSGLGLSIVKQVARSRRRRDRRRGGDRRPSGALHAADGRRRLSAPMLPTRMLSVERRFVL